MSVTDVASAAFGADSLFQRYQPPSGAYDEMFDGDGRPRAMARAGEAARRIGRASWGAAGNKRDG